MKIYLLTKTQVEELEEINAEGNEKVVISDLGYGECIISFLHLEGFEKQKLWFNESTFEEMEIELPED